MKKILLFLMVIVFIKPINIHAQTKQGAQAYVHVELQNDSIMKVLGLHKTYSFKVSSQGILSLPHIHQLVGFTGIIGDTTTQDIRPTIPEKDKVFTEYSIPTSGRGSVTINTDSLVVRKRYLLIAKVTSVNPITVGSFEKEKD